MVLIVQIIHIEWVVKSETKYQLFAACKKLTSSTNMPRTKVIGQKWYSDWTGIAIMIIKQR